MNMKHNLLHSKSTVKVQFRKNKKTCLGNSDTVVLFLLPQDRSCMCVCVCVCVCVCTCLRVIE